MAALNAQFVQRKASSASPEKAMPTPSWISTVPLPVTAPPASTSTAAATVAAASPTAAGPVVPVPTLVPTLAMMSSQSASSMAHEALLASTRARSKEWLELRRKEHLDVCNAVNLDDAARKLSWDILYRTYQRGVGDEVRCPPRAKRGAPRAPGTMGSTRR